MAAKRPLHFLPGSLPSVSYNYVKVNSLIIGGLKIKDALVLADQRPESSYGTIGMDLLSVRPLNHVVAERNVKLIS